MITLILSFALAGPLSRAEDPSRRDIVCMLGLLGSAGATGMLGRTLDVGKSWNEKKNTVEVDTATRSSLGRLIQLYARVLPGLAANTATAKLIDIVADYVRRCEGLPDKEDPTYFSTVMMSNMMIIGPMMLMALVPHTGNASIDNARVERWLANPVTGSLKVSVMSPVLEEFVFRLVPSHVGSGWKTGLASSLAFALAHNITNEGISLQKVPIPEFIGGLFYWYLMRERGFSHAVFAHAAHNNAATMALYLNARFL